MKSSVISLPILLALSVGCGGNTKAFVGTYSVSGSRTLIALGSTGMEEVSGTMRITEGLGSDINIISNENVENEKSCVIPADVDGELATLAPLRTELICAENVKIHTKETLVADLSVKTLNATRDGRNIHLVIKGPVSTTYAGVPVSGELIVDVTLTPLAP